MNYILEKLKDPTTYVGLFALLTGAFGYTLPEDVQAAVTTAAISLAGLVLVFINGRSKKS